MHGKCRPRPITNEDEAHIRPLTTEIFELIVGQPPFDSIMATPVSVVRQMLEPTSDELPERWQAKSRAMDSSWTGDKTENNLQEWLEETYFDGVRREDLKREDIGKVDELVSRLLRFEPETGAEARDILRDPWLRDK
jgi:serine/threonine-protein kinase SRPK3